MSIRRGRGRSHHTNGVLGDAMDKVDDLMTDLFGGTKKGPGRIRIKMSLDQLAKLGRGESLIYKTKDLDIEVVLKP